MWTKRQSLQPAFRFTAAVVMSLWLMATLACAMHCGGFFGAGLKAAQSCCHRVVASANANGSGAAAEHQDSGSPNAGCLKEYLSTKPALLGMAEQAILPQTAWVMPGVPSRPLPPLACERAGERPRCGAPALMLGRGLRTLAPPSSLA